MTITKAIACILILATTPALAVDLTKAKLPLHYECRVTHGGGIWRDESGAWQAGRLPNDKRPFRIVLERYSETKGKRFKECEEAQKLIAGMKSRDREFCLTQSVRDVGESTTYCLLDGISPYNEVVFCQSLGILLDTDKGQLFEDSSVRLLTALRAAGVYRSDCERLDR